MTAAASDLVGLVDIAERLGLARQTVANWRHLDLGFPEPTWSVSGRPVWEWQVVAEWAQATGRDGGIDNHQESTP